MIAVAVRGYGLVVWRDADGWRTYGRSDALAATLTARVETALRTVEGDSPATVRDALLTITGSRLLAEDATEL